jgi:cobyrinic acid a,c-diamide synthase
MAPKSESQLFPPVRKPAVARIAIARDKAFSFYYQDSLDLLAAWGAEVVPFSPLQDADLPGDIAGLYIGGGFPELYAADLAGNKPVKDAIKVAARQGMPVYAECGGLMYLGRSIQDFQGNEHTMVGAIPVSSQIDSSHLSLGYRTVQALHDGPILCRGETVRGHEFHWSVLRNSSNASKAYRILEPEGSQEGFQKKKLLASYIHLHLGSLPHMASRFVENCRQFREKYKHPVVL